MILLPLFLAGWHNLLKHIAMIETKLFSLLLLNANHADLASRTPKAELRSLYTIYSDLGFNLWLAIITLQVENGDITAHHFYDQTWYWHRTFMACRWHAGCLDNVNSCIWTMQMHNENQRVCVYCTVNFREMSDNYHHHRQLCYAAAHLWQFLQIGCG